ncbi:class B sortase [Christensenella tenuis]|uniref:Class B sortase n=1 Tax=Christensenella tenuis TaxID=2763033 RepID=A0ABR7EE39_9FIRM|nr:class B sortase [Christensenella tenuis]MBC5648050.1 class B sortase [Christensenella tenuis]
MGIAAKRIGKKAVKIVDSIVNWMVLVAILLLVATACYAMWDSNLVYAEADAKQYEVYKPAEEDTASFEELRDINREVFGWLTVYETKIDYPVVQGADNMKYVNTNARGEYSLSGAIFLDSGNRQDFADFNSILYGHHMEKQAMFGELGNFAEESFFLNHPHGNLFYEGKDHGLEFFAFVHTDVYDALTFTSNIQGEEAQRDYLDMLLTQAIHTREVDVDIQDRIVLLSTCSLDTTNGRDILAAKISDEVFADRFTSEITEGEHIRAETQQGFLSRVPVWGWVLAGTVLLALIIVIYIHRKRSKRGNTK